jgi:GT2 family glycosyltransferase
MKTAFVILSYRNVEDTVECINSILNINTPRSEYAIILIDNSEDEGQSLNDIKCRTKVDYAIETSNNGYSHGNNIGIKIAYENDFDYICVINNDTIVFPDFLDELLSVITENESETALVAPLIYTYSDRKIWSSGGFYNALRSNYVMTREQLQDISEAEFVNGCCFLFHRKLIDLIGYMDEDYFMYNEDADWCYKIAKLSLKNYVVPKSNIYHKVSLSSGTNSPFQIYYLYKNRFMFIKKSKKGFGKLYAYSVNFAQVFIRMIQYSIKEPKCAKALWHAILDAPHVIGRGRY